MFGITGDLAQRKLLPAIYHLFKDGLVHEDTVILGISRRGVTTDELLSQVELCVNEVDKVCDPAALHQVQQALRMHQMRQTDGAEYDQLLQLLNDIENERGMCLDRLYYLSIPPQMFEPIVRNLGQHGHNGSCQHGVAATRLLIEKPFGYDAASAVDLLAETGEWFSEEQTFRVDHYVAKNAVVDLLDFRSSHPESGDLWNAQHIAAVTITAYEQLDIEGRAIFYDAIGALRDIIQSHLLQVMAVALMPLPAVRDSTDLHAARLALLQAVQPIRRADIASQTVRGQYYGYRDEVGRDDTLTETYAAVTLDIDNDQWRGVPVTLRTGKAMAAKTTEVRLAFRSGEEFVCHIQPDAGLEITKNPSTETDPVQDHLQAIVGKFQASAGEREHFADAYERILVEAARGNHNLFTSRDEVLAAWHIIGEVVEAWAQSTDGLVLYPKGSSEVRQAP